MKKMDIILAWVIMTALGLVACFILGCYWIYENISATLAYIIFFGIPYLIVSAIVVSKFFKWKKK